VRRPGC